MATARHSVVGGESKHAQCIIYIVERSPCRIESVVDIFVNSKQSCCREQYLGCAEQVRRPAESWVPSYVLCLLYKLTHSPPSISPTTFPPKSLQLTHRSLPKTDPCWHLCSPCLGPTFPPQLDFSQPCANNFLRQIEFPAISWLPQQSLKPIHLGETLPPSLTGTKAIQLSTSTKLLGSSFIGAKSTLTKRVDTAWVIWEAKKILGDSPWSRRGGSQEDNRLSWVLSWPCTRFPRTCRWAPGQSSFRI